MQSIKKIGSLVLVLFITLVFSAPIISIAAEAPINLGTAVGYAILAGQTITNTGTTVINGNVGIAPGSAFTQGPAIINGVIHINDAAAIQAKQDLVVAFNDAAGRLPETIIPAELGGTTLTPGYYVSSSGSFNLTGILTLDAGNDPDALFVFETASTLITATASNINLINGANSAQVFWNIGSSATLGITSHLEGTILAMESITLTTGATINGSLLARNGSVTLDSNTVGSIVGTPVIAIDKTANKTQIINSPEMVTYNYRVTNPGVTNLENVAVTDDKIAIVNYLSGDTNLNLILEPTEIWLYTANTMLNNTTTNVGTVTATLNGAAVVASDLYTVTLYVEPVVTTQPTTIATTETSTETTEATTATTESQGFEVPELVDSTIESTESSTTEPTETVTEVDTPPTSPVEPGGSLPQTATPLMLYLSSGAALILLGIAGMKFIK
jgi:hypothetical protein